MTLSEWEVKQLIADVARLESEVARLRSELTKLQAAGSNNAQLYELSESFNYRVFARKLESPE